MSGKCAVCAGALDREDAPIIAIGATGVKRCLCSSCAELIDTATESTDYGAIAEAMDRISEKMGKADIYDPLTIDAMDRLMNDAAKRAKAIKEGTYEPKTEEADGFEEIPEELRETEEDRELDEKEEEQNKKLDKIMNWVTAGIIVAVAAFMIWWFWLR